MGIGCMIGVTINKRSKNRRAVKKRLHVLYLCMTISLIKLYGINHLNSKKAFGKKDVQ